MVGLVWLIATVLLLVCLTVVLCDLIDALAEWAHGDGIDKRPCEMEDKR